ncbi:MAG: hypothetical protein A2156_05265 [Deltaproteobacteria bacterium RBG_16_48_10]|nr:MAG: hypothetical protein A2156_05265 [Deltaproteobacteria bacterium RBG_16_48_10]
MGGGLPNPKIGKAFPSFISFDFNAICSTTTKNAIAFLVVVELQSASQCNFLRFPSAACWRETNTSQKIILDFYSGSCYKSLHFFRGEQLFAVRPLFYFAWSCLIIKILGQKGGIL